MRVSVYVLLHAIVLQLGLDVPEARPWGRKGESIIVGVPGVSGPTCPRGLPTLIPGTKAASSAGDGVGLPRGCPGVAGAPLPGVPPLAPALVVS